VNKQTTALRPGHEYQHYLDHDIAEPMDRIVQADNVMVVEACCVLIELMACTQPGYRDAAVERWPQLASRISADPDSEIAKMPGPFRTMMALNIENSTLADEHQDLWRIANILRHRVR